MRAEVLKCALDACVSFREAEPRGVLQRQRHRRGIRIDGPARRRGHRFEQGEADAASPRADVKERQAAGGDCALSPSASCPWLYACPCPRFRGSCPCSCRVGKGDVHEQLSLGPRDQNRRAHYDGDVVKVPLPQDVLQRLAPRAPPHLAQEPARRSPVAAVAADARRVGGGRRRRGRGRSVRRHTVLLLVTLDAQEGVEAGATGRVDSEGTDHEPLGGGLAVFEMGEAGLGAR